MSTSGMGSIATVGIVADAAALLSDRDCLYAGAASATGLGDPADVRDPRAGDETAACLRRCAIDLTLGGRAAESGGFRDRAESGSASLPVTAEPTLWVYGSTRSPGSAAAAYERHFTSVMTAQGIGEHAVPLHATDEIERRMSGAVSLLRDLLPEITGSVLPFVHRAVVLASPVTSLYLTQVPETVFVSEGVVRGDPLGLADAVLHESLHEKMAVLRLTRQLMRPGYTDGASARVLLPWSLGYAEPRWFNAGRVISAAHVYAHLAVLHATALRDGAAAPTGCDTGTLRRRLATAVERGGYLLRALVLKDVRRELGADGVLLHRQLTAMVDEARRTLPRHLDHALHTWRDLPERDVVAVGRPAAADRTEAAADRTEEVFA